MRSAGDNDSTAVKAAEDQLAVRRAFRAKHPRAPRRRAGTGAPNEATPIDSSLGTGLIDNIICEPEDGERRRAEAADDILDRYSDAGEHATARTGAPTRAPRDPCADDELDEIELQLRLQPTQPIPRATLSGPRGTADLAPDATHTRSARSRWVRQPASRHARPGARPLAVATLIVAAIVLSTVVLARPAGSTRQAPSSRAHRIMNTAADSAPAVTPRQLDSAARLRASVPINAEKATVARAEMKRRHARARAAHRRAAQQARARAAARAAALTHALHSATGSSSLSTSSTSEPSPTADGGSATANTSSASTQRASSAAPAGPTGGIGSMTGGCTPQC